jgi:orotidine 5'-phosphate decarboxylase subfamily 2
MTFTYRLDRALRHSSICVGLDPDPDLIPPVLRSEKNPILQFNRAIIDATCDLVGAYKPNFAFYEAHGHDGLTALEDTVPYIRSRSKSALIIADAKRGDMGNTAMKYSKSILHNMDFDCVTLNPYLGFDSIEPFIHDDSKGAFILCLTSNSGSKDFQYSGGSAGTLYEQVAEKVLEWNSHKNCGLVVGGTHPEEMKHLRAIAGSLPFLIPGIGSQGGDLDEAVKINFDGTKINALINSSRAILYASNETNFAEAARKAVIEMKDRIEKSLAILK